MEPETAQRTQASTAPPPAGAETARAPAPLERADQAPSSVAGDPGPACLLCDSPDVVRAFLKSGKWFCACRTCSFVFVDDIYPEYDALDEEEYGELVDLERELRRKEIRVHARLLASFEPHRATNRLLEVGCGQGLFLTQARTAGWSTVGVEILPSLVQVARATHGLEVVQGELSSAGFEPDSFDVVYMNEVIEHVVDPVELMVEVRRILAPGGVAVLRTGSAESWSARFRGGGWWYYHFCPHGHIRFFGPRSARALARAAGFEGVTTHTQGFAFLDGSETRGRWYRPLLKLLQALPSSVAGWFGAGHKLTMRFTRPVDRSQA
jgi:SAM-dependent methyltransferase